MKRLVAGGSGSIFQFSRCFRDHETPSRLHQPEFLMLEWYTVDADYRDSLETTEALVGELTDDNTRPGLRPPFRTMSIEEAFRAQIGIDLAKCQETDVLRDAARHAGAAPADDDSWADIFHLLMVSMIEPTLPRDKPLVLLDYPKQVRCLAKAKSETLWRERWELYLDGIETANCFSELTDRAEVAALIATETSDLMKTGVPDRTDHTFPDIYSAGHPPCSGVALGVDRLIMALTGANSIAEIMPFPRI